MVPCVCVAFEKRNTEVELFWVDGYWAFPLDHMFWADSIRSNFEKNTNEFWY